MTVNPEIVRDVRGIINDILDKVEHDDLPMPYDFTPDCILGSVSVDWMLQEDLTGSRAVMNAFPGTWSQSRSSRASEPIWDYVDDDRFLKITLWSHPDTIQMSVQIP